MITFLRLIRAPNIITSISNVCAGAFIIASLQSTLPLFGPLFKLMLCSAMMYACGIIWNDIFDLEVDKKVRPNRPLPSGAIKISTAFTISAIFSILTILISATISLTAVLLCLSIMISALLYDTWWKHNDWAGSVAMGLCRSLNLSLGFCVFSSFSFHPDDPYLAIAIFFTGFHFLYIFSVTYVGTMQEGQAPNLKIMISFVLLFLLILYVTFIPNVLYFTAKFLIIVLLAGGFYRLQLIYRFKKPRDIGLTVKYGILSLIPLDAIFTTVLATGFTSMIPALIMLLLFFPLSFGLAKAIEMT
jgi:heme O synthase-like polyprenyltransferase